MTAANSSVLPLWVMARPTTNVRPWPNVLGGAWRPQAWLVPKQGPTRPGSVSLPTDLTRRRRRLRIVCCTFDLLPPQESVKRCWRVC